MSQQLNTVILAKITRLIDTAIVSNYLFPSDKKEILSVLSSSDSAEEASKKVLHLLKASGGIPQIYVDVYFNSKVVPLLKALYK